MGLNDTPSAERVHIGFFGLRNAGKSSLVNAVTNQDLAVVSDTKGTTTDPVSKSMELLPLGPVMIIDTPGYDDEGELGLLRVKKTKQVLNKTDIAVLVVDIQKGITSLDRELVSLFEDKKINYIIAYNKCEMKPNHSEPSENEIYVSAEKNIGIYELKEKLAYLKPNDEEIPLVKDLLSDGDIVVLVTPIDSSAPKGRMILPQQMMMRDVLDANAIVAMCKETELSKTLESLSKKPKMVITDSQVFGLVSKLTPDDVPLTSFSILLARHKGFLREAVMGVTAIDRLKDGDTVLIAEGCTHHRQCDDIGSVKIPHWLKERTNANFDIELSSGTGFPDDLSKYSLILHCGGCMLNTRELVYRTKCAFDQNVPMTNYGLAIAYMNGILERGVKVLPDLYEDYLKEKNK